jgi:EmrB/QacA subfamily drug resistance transporter
VPSPAAGGRLLSTVMLGVASGAILVPLNSTMLAVALPGVMGEFGLGASAVSSLVSLYLGVVAIALPVSGSLGDRFGPRRTFLIGVVGFGAASLVAALAGTFVLLQVARVLQAVFGAFVSTSAAVLIRETAPPERRGEAFGLFDLLTSTSAAIGPFIGGLIVGGFGWRSMFFLAVPIAILSAVLVGIVIRPSTGPRTAADGVPEPGPAREPRRIDVPGLVLLGLAIAAFLIALRGTAMGELGTVATIGLAPLLLAFILVELRTTHPAVDPHLFRRRAYASAVAGIFGQTVVLHGSFVLVPLLVENVLGQSATTSGIVLLGIAGVGAIVAPFGGRASDRLGRRIMVVAGSIVMALGLLALWIPAGSSSPAIVAVLLGIVGLGMGLAGSPRQAAAFDGIESSRLGMAAGTLYTGRYLGGVVGASMAGAVLGATVTAPGVSLGFGILTVTAVLVAAVSLGLPGRGGERAAAVPEPVIES